MPGMSGKENDIMITIGLTGGIASGKSTVSKMIQERHIPLIDADIIAREVVEPGEKAYHQIVETFGKDVLFEDGSLNRKKLGNIIFQDEAKRKALNGIVHPQVRKRMKEKIDTHKISGAKAIVLDIPLLFESRLTDWVDKILLVFVDPDIQVQRLINRDGITKSDALDRIGSQLSLEEKRRDSDAVINNNGQVKETFDQLSDILEYWDIC